MRKSNRYYKRKGTNKSVVQVVVVLDMVSFKKSTIRQVKLKIPFKMLCFHFDKEVLKNMNL